MFTFNAEVSRQLRDQFNSNLEDVGVLFTNTIKQNVNRENNYIKKGLSYRATTPSLPGEYSRKARGRLQHSWNYQVDKTKMELTEGSGEKVAAWMEKGTRNMLPRPNLQMTLYSLAREIQRMLKKNIDTT